MISMKSRTPLDPDSWTVMGATLKNPGEMGYDYSNNHTHLQKFKGKWYMFYHTQSLRKQMNIKGGYRSICYREADVDEDRVTINIR